MDSTPDTHVVEQSSSWTIRARNNSNQAARPYIYRRSYSEPDPQHQEANNGTHHNVFEARVTAFAAKPTTQKMLNELHTHSVTELRRRNAERQARKQQNGDEPAPEVTISEERRKCHFSEPSSLLPADQKAWHASMRTDVKPTYPHLWLRLASIFSVQSKTWRQPSLLSAAAEKAATLDRGPGIHTENYMIIRDHQNRNYAREAVAEGIKLKEQNRLREAMDHYKRALDMDPKYADGWFRVAEGLLQEHKKAEAIEQLQRALHNDPDHTGAKTLLCNIKNTTIASNPPPAKNNAVDRPQSKDRMRSIERERPKRQNTRRRREKRDERRRRNRRCSSSSRRESHSSRHGSSRRRGYDDEEKEQGRDRRKRHADDDEDSYSRRRKRSRSYMDEDDEGRGTGRRDKRRSPSERRSELEDDKIKYPVRPEDKMDIDNQSPNDDKGQGIVNDEKVDHSESSCTKSMHEDKRHCDNDRAKREHDDDPEQNRRTRDSDDDNGRRKPRDSDNNGRSRRGRRDGDDNRSRRVRGDDNNERRSRSTYGNDDNHGKRARGKDDNSKRRHRRSRDDDYSESRQRKPREEDNENRGKRARDKDEDDKKGSRRGREKSSQERRHHRSSQHRSESLSPKRERRHSYRSSRTSRH